MCKSKSKSKSQNPLSPLSLTRTRQSYSPPSFSCVLLLMSASGGCCRFCARFLVTAGFTALFLWLSLRTSGPTCTVEDLYLPALNQSANATSNTSLYFYIRLKNGNKDKGIYYDALNLSFYYLPNSTTNLSIANFTLPPFHQGHDKKAKRMHTLNESDPIRRVPNTTVSFRVALATKVRYKILLWKTKRHEIDVRADVEVSSGKKLKKGGIELNSGAPEHRLCYLAPPFVGFLGILAAFLLAR